MLFAQKINAIGGRIRFDAKLRQMPLPLLDADRRTVVSWSAKSACTHVVIWFLHRLGLLDEARSYHPWVHRYRGEVLFRSSHYQRAREQLREEGASEWTYVKVVRDPVKRCVSSYRHALQHGYEDEKMTMVLGHDIDHRTGYSYETFLDYLAKIDLHHCDIHHRVQKHSLDTVEFGRTWLINVDAQDLDSILARIDRMQGCVPLNENAGGAEAIASAARRHAPEEEDGRRDMSEQWCMPLRAGDVKRWPKHSLVSASRPAELVRNLYGCDYELLSKLKKRSESA